MKRFLLLLIGMQGYCAHGINSNEWEQFEGQIKTLYRLISDLSSKYTHAKEILTGKLQTFYESSESYSLHGQSLPKVAEELVKLCTKLETAVVDAYTQVNENKTEIDQYFNEYNQAIDLLTQALQNVNTEYIPNQKQSLSALVNDLVTYTNAQDQENRKLKEKNDKLKTELKQKIKDTNEQDQAKMELKEENDKLKTELKQKIEDTKAQDQENRELKQKNDTFINNRVRELETSRKSALSQIVEEIKKRSQRVKKGGPNHEKGTNLAEEKEFNDLIKGLEEFLETIDHEIVKVRTENNKE